MAFIATSVGTFGYPTSPEKKRRSWLSAARWLAVGCRPANAGVAGVGGEADHLERLA